MTYPILQERPRVTPEILASLPPDMQPAFAPFVNLVLESEDGINLESNWHRNNMNLLIGSILHHRRDRRDYFVGGNMFIYFNVEQFKKKDFRGPDFFLVEGVEFYYDRKYWAVWEEHGRYPDVIIELVSPTTADVDRTVKKDIYEKTFRCRNYFCYDPQTQLLEGWELREGGYEALALNEKGRMWSSVLQLWLGIWDGEYQRLHNTWLRYFDGQDQLILIAEEAETLRANEMQKRAEDQQKRAELAEAELKHLQALLKQQNMG